LEKRVAHYSLDLVKKLILKQKYRITGTAYKDAVSLGFDEEDILETIVRLSPRELYKSMTTYKDVKIWQDVYHIAVHEIKLYVKLQITDDAIIISFKERN